MLLTMSFASLTLNLERRLFTTLRARADDKSTLPPHLLTGQRGEDAAFFHLRALGYTIVARRWRTRRLPGDLDLVAWDGDTLVIFEIKSLTVASRDRLFAPAELQVDRPKQDMLRKMATAYLHRIPEPRRASVNIRFDILSVYFLPASTEFDHLRGAFPRTVPPRYLR
jgi:putative endonuclease